MTITARDIQLKQFKVRLKGFDVQEVDFFLDQLAESFTNLEIDNSRLADGLKKAKQEIEDLKERDEKLKKAYQDLRRSYVSLKEEAGSGAAAHLRDAQAEADRILSEARSRVAAMNEDLARLREQKEQIDAYLKRVLELTSDILGRDDAHRLSQDSSDSRVKHLRPIQS